jgi:hypothetical protein
MVMYRLPKVSIDRKKKAIAFITTSTRNLHSHVNYDHEKLNDINIGLTHMSASQYNRHAKRIMGVLMRTIAALGRQT